MTIKSKIPDFDASLILSEAEKIARENSEMFWDESVITVLSVCSNFPELFPNLGNCNSCLDYITKWLQRYFRAYGNRASQRTSNQIGTIPDEIVDVIISTRLPSLSSNNINLIKSAQR